MLILDIDTDNAARRLEQMAHRADQSRQLLTALSDDVRRAESELFASGGNGQWAPLDPATVRAKGSNRRLVDTGELMRHLTAAPKISGDELTVTGTDYMHFHIAGTGRMPRRDPAPTPTPAQLNSWAEELLGHLVGHD